MGDIKQPWLLYLKGFLFLLLGTMAGLGLLALHPDWTTAGLLLLCVWAFCRFYYFLFYVIEKYADPGYRFAGLWSFVRYVLERKKRHAP